MDFMGSRIIKAIVVCSVAGVANLTSAATRIEMEIGTERGFPLTGAQTWSRRLNDVGVDRVRIRGARPGDKPDSETFGPKGAQTIHLTGVLTARDQLILPGGRFGRGDMTKLKQYLATLKADGLAGVTEKKGAFGLTDKQLTEAVEDMTRLTDFVTRGQPPLAILEHAAARAALKIHIAPQAAAALREASPCEEEYLGLALGTSLAAMLRPHGLILQPRRKSGGPIEHTIAIAKPSSEAWPVGWPPEVKDRELVPKLYEFLSIEIERIPLPEALAAIQKRLEIPVLFDRNSMARHGVDMAAQQVSIPPGRTYYKKVLERLLFQAKLKSEIRIDEAGRPFLWVTTLKR